MPLSNEYNTQTMLRQFKHSNFWWSYIQDGIYKKCSKWLLTCSQITTLAFICWTYITLKPLILALNPSTVSYCMVSQFQCIQIFSCLPFLLVKEWEMQPSIWLLKLTVQKTQGGDPLRNKIIIYVFIAHYLKLFLWCIMLTWWLVTLVSLSIKEQEKSKCVVKFSTKEIAILHPPTLTDSLMRE